MLLYKDNNSNSNEYGLNFNFDLDSLSIQGENSIVLPTMKPIIRKISLISQKITWKYLIKII